MQNMEGGAYRDVEGRDFAGAPIRVSVIEAGDCPMLMVFHPAKAQMYCLERDKMLKLANSLAGFIDGKDEVAEAARDGSLNFRGMVGNKEAILGFTYLKAKEGACEGISLIVDRCDEEYPGINNVALSAHEAYKLYKGMLAV